MYIVEILLEEFYMALPVFIVVCILVTTFTFPIGLSRENILVEFRLTLILKYSKQSYIMMFMFSSQIEAWIKKGHKYPKIIQVPMKKRYICFYVLFFIMMIILIKHINKLA